MSSDADDMTENDFVDDRPTIRDGSYMMPRLL